MKLRTIFTTFSTTLVVAGLAAVWSVASPLSAGCAAATPPEQITPVPSESSQFVAAVNQLRVSKGLNALIVDSNLTSIADNWAVTMAGQDNIFHRSNLADGVTINWKRLGENVGEGPTVTDLMNAFIASPHHYENLVDPTFTHIGIGSARTPDGLMYTAHEFAAVVGYPSAASPASNPAPAPAPTVAAPRPVVHHVAAAPRVTAPPTTAAPTTTTTAAPPVEVSRSVAHHNKLNDGSADDQQQQNNKGNGRCGAQGGHKVVATGGTATAERAA